MGGIVVIGWLVGWAYYHRAGGFHGHKFCSFALYIHYQMHLAGGLHLKPTKFEYIFVNVITFFPFLLYKYF